MVKSSNPACEGNRTGFLGSCLTAAGSLAGAVLCINTQ